MFGLGSVGLRRGLFVTEGKMIRQNKNLTVFTQKGGSLLFTIVEGGKL